MIITCAQHGKGKGAAHARVKKGGGVSNGLNILGTKGNVVAMLRRVETILNMS